MISRIFHGVFPSATSLTLLPPSNVSTHTLSPSSTSPSGVCNVTTAVSSLTFASTPSSMTEVSPSFSPAPTPLLGTGKQNALFVPPTTSSAPFYSKHTCHPPSGLNPFTAPLTYSISDRPVPSMLKYPTIFSTAPPPTTPPYAPLGACATQISTPPCRTNSPPARSAASFSACPSNTRDIGASTFKPDVLSPLATSSLTKISFPMLPHPSATPLHVNSPPRPQTILNASTSAHLHHHLRT